MSWQHAKFVQPVSRIPCNHRDLNSWTAEQMTCSRVHWDSWPPFLGAHDALLFSWDLGRGPKSPCVFWCSKPWVQPYCRKGKAKHYLSIPGRGNGNPTWKWLLLFCRWRTSHVCLPSGNQTWGAGRYTTLVGAFHIDTPKKLVDVQLPRLIL